MMRLQEDTREELDLPHDALVKKINKKVDKQQSELGEIFRNQLIPGMAKHNILLVNESDLGGDQLKFAREYYKNEVSQHVNPVYIDENADPPFLLNRRLYFAVRVSFQESGKKSETIKNVILNIPSNKISRFVVLPSEADEHLVIQLDDVMRVSLDLIFPGKKVIYCYAIKLSRDAELYLDDEFSERVLDKIKSSLGKRDTGVPSRFLYDLKMPRSFLHYLRVVFRLDSEDLIPGGKYHNFNEFFGFPAPDDPEFYFEKFESLPHIELANRGSILEAVREKDYILHFPYQSYDTAIRFIQEAANDPAVESIKITLYRVASDSRVAQALITAAEKGVAVTVFDEVQARFDEESNIYWGDELQKAGAKVIYSYEKLKVHSKLCLVARREGNEIKRYAFLASGNFNEKTARIYGDHGLLTANDEITIETDRVFDYLEDPERHSEVQTSFGGTVSSEKEAE